MKTVIVVCFFALATVVLARPDEKYTDKWDSVNLDEILQNIRLYTPYMNCMLDKGKCAPDAKELKGHIHEAMENNCAKCTDAQKEGTRKVISHLINKNPEDWKELSAKYDPDQKYTKQYEKELTEIKE